ncbi:MAG: hypothetical protein DWQ53_09810 [Microcystis flos-aquae DF17]|nr:MAG: hypothetical protein DWQ53_09810 [Microcystis flos-aquae DF17]
MVQVKLKGQVTSQDVEALERAYRDVQRLTVGLKPTAPASGHLTAILWTMRSALLEWRGDRIDRAV